MNKPIRNLAVACMLMFVALLVNVTFVQYWEADDLTSLSAHPDNKRVRDAEFARERGLEVLATILGSAYIADEYAYLARTPAKAAARVLDKAGKAIDDVAAKLDDFTGDFVAQHQADLGSGAAADHVLVGAANVGGNHLEDHAVLDLLAARVLHLGVVDILYLDLASAAIHHSTITRHALTSLDLYLCSVG